MKDLRDLKKLDDAGQGDGVRGAPLGVRHVDICEHTALARLLTFGNGPLWQGKATGCVEYLTGCGYTCESFNNPADFIMDVVLGNEVP